MKRHLLSFLRSPIGYASNLVATIAQYVPILDQVMPVAWLCETFCARDGVQSDPFF